MSQPDHETTADEIAAILARNAKFAADSAGMETISCETCAAWRRRRRETGDGPAKIAADSRWTREAVRMHIAGRCPHPPLDADTDDTDEKHSTRAEPAESGRGAATED